MDTLLPFSASKLVTFRYNSRFQDLQKLIAAADSGAEGLRRAERKSAKKKMISLQAKKGEIGQEAKVAEGMSSIKFPDYKGTGVMLRSQRMKLPASISQKKLKAIEQIQSDFNVDMHPMPTPKVSQLFNELRSDTVLLYDLKMAHVNCEVELQTLRYKWDALAPGRIQPTSKEPEIKLSQSSVTVKTEDKGSEVGFTTGSDSTDTLIDVVNPTSSTQKKRHHVAVSTNVPNSKKMKN